jgi:hypothetical protein
MLARIAKKDRPDTTRLVKPRSASNRTMQPTASPRTALLWMTKPSSLQSNLAALSGG